jgi:hypothetical protein
VKIQTLDCVVALNTSSVCGVGTYLQQVRPATSQPSPYGGNPYGGSPYGMGYGMGIGYGGPYGGMGYGH